MRRRTNRHRSAEALGGGYGAPDLRARPVTLLAFFIGCVVGCLLRASLTRRRRRAMTGQLTLPRHRQSPTRRRRPRSRRCRKRRWWWPRKQASLPPSMRCASPPRPRCRRPAMPAEPPEVSPRAAEPRPEPVASSRPEPPPAGGRPKRPRGLAAPRNDRPDNLQRISGIGPKLEKTLQDLGFFHYDQIAAWDPMEVDWINEHLRFAAGSSAGSGSSRRGSLLRAGRSNSPRSTARGCCATTAMSAAAYAAGAGRERSS